MRHHLLVLLFLLSLFIEGQAIRLKHGLAAINRQKNHVLQGKNDKMIEVVVGQVVYRHGDHSHTIGRRLSREAKKTHHMLPEFHEDYYGPKIHKPRHH
ncbi:hypothetical protein FRX31_002379 [Thalictrum thalictroides]|uniref:Root meristem growth factor n=1 Tax=Thalictrum thalictroides TaxID=46969 RepID=A0A7J6XG04_THATH|nr:hypothetical protein FRX31_002379 [Thalictrum thalictroides]